MTASILLQASALLSTLKSPSTHIYSKDPSLNQHKRFLTQRNPVLLNEFEQGDPKTTSNLLQAKQAKKTRWISIMTHAALAPPQPITTRAISPPLAPTKFLKKKIGSRFSFFIVYFNTRYSPAPLAPTFQVCRSLSLYTDNRGQRLAVYKERDPCF